MRHRILIAALLAGSVFSPGLAQEVEATIAAETQTQAVVERVAVADNQEERRGRSEGGFGRRDAGGEGMRAAPEQVERAPRQDWQQRQQAQPQAEPEPRRDWVRQRMENNGDARVQQREAPLVMAAPVAPTTENRGWRGDWQRRSEEVANSRNPTPPVMQQAPVEANRSWRGNGNTNNDNWRRGDRDNDGIRNGRDRDRDGDGIRNNRDWDRNNNGRVDGRWDRDRNGSVDWRWDRNRDGIRNNGGNWNNGGSWNNNQRYGNNQGWNRQWRNDNRYNWERHRFSNRDLFRQPRYYSPYGYNARYQRFGIGIYLDSVFFGSRYRINDPWQYRLPYAEWPYEWVRYYDDVLLVDTRNGYIVDVINNFFW